LIESIETIQSRLRITANKYKLMLVGKVQSY
jgi:hypothetical protein